jgi:hypothetical protein
VPGIEARSATPGRRHGCALDRSGGVICWGTNQHAALGASDPAAADAMPIRAGAVAVDSSDEHTCALLAGGSIACWGRNDDGRIELGGPAMISEPRPIDLGAEAHAIAVGYLHACAIVGSDRSISCFGLEDRYPISPPQELRGVSSVSTMLSDTCAVSAGRVFCWGYFSGSSTTALPLAGDTEEVAAGEFHACARSGDGRVWCWPYGQAPREIEGVDAVQLAAGTEFTCARDPSGAVLCWGANGYVLPPTSDWTRPRAIAGAGASIEISAGVFGACSVAEGGPIFCWGDNGYGQIDRNPPLERSGREILIND